MIKKCFPHLKALSKYVERDKRDQTSKSKKARDATTYPRTERALPPRIQLITLWPNTKKNVLLSGLSTDLVSLHQLYLQYVDSHKENNNKISR